MNASVKGLMQIRYLNMFASKKSSYIHFSNRLQRRPNNKRQGSFGPKRPKKLFSPTRQKVLNPIAGVRRLRKKVGNALKEYTYRKRGSGRGNCK